MSILGIILGIAVGIALYIWTKRSDQNYYKRRQELIAQRGERLQARKEEQEKQCKSVEDKTSGD